MVSSYAELQKNIKYSTFLSTIEMAMVNGSRYTGGSSFHMLRENFSEEEVFKYNINKQFHANYFNKCIIFYKDVKLICEKLKNYPKEDIYNPKNERKNVLKVFLKNLNKRIHLMYNEEEDIKLAKSVIKGLYRGIILPFDDSKSTEDEDCNLIVNLNIENSCCLSTRARVPCKIVFECVNVKDLINFDNYYIDNIEDDKNRNSTDSGDGIIENQNDNNILVNDFGTVEEFLNGSFEDEEEKKIKEKKEEKIEEIVKEINYYNENKKEKPKEENLEENIRVRKNSEISLADFQSEFGEIFGVRWKEITNEIKLKSNYRNFPSLQIKSFIAKANDDLRQESLTMQLIKCFSDIFKKEEIPLKLKTYEIIITSANSGLIEFIPNTLSIDALKKK
jgi:phosphatidylinositol 4-kinase